MIPVPVISLPLFDPPSTDDVHDHDIEVTSHVEITAPSTPIVVRIEEPAIPFRDAALDETPGAVRNWDDFVGQEPLKAQMLVYILDAQRRMDRLPHWMFASGFPGVGKTTLAEEVAKKFGVTIKKMVPPFNAATLHEAALSMPDYGILFIDEIHKLADSGPRAAENLYHIMAEGKLYLDDGVHQLNDFTICGATTDADKLPEPLVDRFKIKPYFQRYSLKELVRITHNFARFYDAQLSPLVLVAIAKACRGVPRICDELVLGARAWQSAYGRPVKPQELLAFKELEWDGMTRQHIAYTLALFQFFGREQIVNNETRWEYVAGEASLMNLLRENKPGLARLERFLIERGLVDRTPRGRRLTDRGILKAQDYMARGMGLSTG